MSAGKGPGSGANGGRGGPYEAELPLDLADRLPWLEGDEAERDEGTGRILALLVLAVILLALAGSGFWYIRHRQQVAAMAIAGGVIKAPPGPYKVRPTDPGGSKASGTGMTVYSVAQGRNLRGDALPQAVASDLATPAAAVESTKGFGVQIGAYGGKDEAERAWPTFTTRFPILSGVGHRVVETPGDLGTVYALQAVTATRAGANALCEQLRAGALKCEVRE
jgi:hypothetical protein